MDGYVLNRFATYPRIINLAEQARNRLIGGYDDLLRGKYDDKPEYRKADDIHLYTYATRQ